MSWRRSLLTATVLGAGLAASAASAQTIRYAHFQPGELDQPKHAAATAFQTHVEARTDLEVEIFPASQLGGGGEIMEGLQLGTIQLGVVHDGPVASVYEPIQVFMIPYLFENKAEAWGVYDSEFTQELSDDMREQTGIRLLALADNGIRHFTNNERPVRSPDDMEGLSIRVQPGEIYQRLVSSVGANPEVVPWPELPGALEQGVVDGQENSVTNILAADLNQFQEHISLDGHMYSFHAYMMNADFYEGLSDSEQAVVDQGIDIAKTIHRGMTTAQDLNAERILSQNDMTVTPLTPEEIDAFRELAQQPAIDWLRDSVGDRWVDGILDALEDQRM